MGDDIVLFEEDVSQRYLELMRGLGVEINLSKSVLAVKPCAEFAKITSLHGVDVSGLSWKMFMSQNTIMGRVAIIRSLIRKGYVKKHFIS